MRGFVVGAALVPLLVAGCHRAKQYEANVEVTRITAVRKDASGAVLTVDLELGYVDCPGTQLEVIRGGAEFAACTAGLKVGDRVKVGIEHAWVSEGHFTSTVKQVGDCKRVRDPSDEASYALVRECEDWVINGAPVGFQCNYKPEKKLLAKCPWFRRH